MDSAADRSVARALTLVGLAGAEDAIEPLADTVDTIPVVPQRAELPAVGAATLGRAVDWAALDADLAGLNVLSSVRELKAHSRDFYWYSPILSQALDDRRADRVVKVSTEDDVIRVARAAARHGVPLTLRGAGTGNYGQCVPLAGGIVLDTSEMMRVLELQPGRLRVQGGARMHDMDQAARDTGQMLRMWPSTWRVATIAGFIAGGFGGIGSTAHGVLRDPGNLLRCRVVTVEHEPRVIELVGDEIQQVHHAYGTNGIITEVELALSPAVDWLHVVAHFPGAVVDTASGYRQVLDAAGAICHEGVETFVLSAVDARFAPCYPALAEHFPPGRHALFAMVAPDAQPAFERIVHRRGGVVSMALYDDELEEEGLPPAYECSYNHTTLQALKADRGWTYLQVAYPQPFDPALVQRQMARWDKSRPGEVWQHQEFARMHGHWATFALLLVRWKGADRMAGLIREIEADGCLVFNPHVVTIEDGGMKTIDDAQIAFKRRADPYGLLNPGKTRGWLPSMARPWAPPA
jgi:FAD/FMN-containing dehydrogenase